MNQLARSTEIHLRLPIAPHANHRLRNAEEGTLPPAQVPAEAITWLHELRKGGKQITAIELCGPGDALASWNSTRACLELLQEETATPPLSVTCLGLGGAERTADLDRLGVNKATLLVDAVSADTAGKLYAWIRPGKKTIPLSQAVKVLLQEQAKTVKSLCDAGIKVVIQTRIEEGVNDHEVSIIAKKMADLGAVAMEITGTDENLQKLADQAAPYLETMVVQSESALPPPCDPESCSVLGSALPKPDKKRPNIAVASIGGMEVDLHLGQAGKLLIYGPREDGLACLLETRLTPPSGSPNRWQSVANSLSDCFALLATHAGEVPRKQLAEKGIKIIFTDGQIEAEVDVLYGGGKKKKCKK